MENDLVRVNVRISRGSKFSREKEFRMLMPEIDKSFESFVKMKAQAF